MKLFNFYVDVNTIIIVLVLIVLISFIVYYYIIRRNRKYAFISIDDSIEDPIERLLYIIDHDTRLTDILNILIISNTNINDLDKIRSGLFNDFINRFVNSAGNLIGNTHIMDIKEVMYYDNVYRHNIFTLYEDWKSLKQLYYLIMDACQCDDVRCHYLYKFKSDFKLNKLLGRIDNIIETFHKGIEKVEYRERFLNVVKYILKDIYK